MKWDFISSNEDLEKIMSESLEQSILIFKHSKRCGTSFLVLNILESQWKDEDAPGIKPYMLDLVNHREISKQVEKLFNVKHESPQILLIKNGECVYNDSHGGISYNEIIKFAA